MGSNQVSFFTSRAVQSDRMIYTPDAFAKDALLHLQEVGRLKALEPHSSHRNHLQSYLFFRVLDGTGVLTYDGREYALSKGDCVFIDCMLPYTHRCTEALWSLQWVHFWGVSMPQVYKKYTERGGKPVFHTDVPEQYQNCLDILQSIAASSDFIRDMRINEQLNMLLTLLMDETCHMEEQAGKKREHVADIKEYLQAHYQERIRLDDLASYFYISKFYLVKIFKEQYGMTVNAYLLQLRITKAKQLLRFTDLSVEEVGVQCGIPEVNYFSRAFKKIEGMTPRKYRQLW